MLNNTTSVVPTVTSYRQASEQHVALRTGLGIISFFSFTGNGLLVLMFITNRDMLRTPYSMFIFSLAITDMTTGWMNHLFLKTPSVISIRLFIHIFINPTVLQ